MAKTAETVVPVVAETVVPVVAETEEVQIGLEEPLVYSAQSVIDDLIQVKSNVEQSESVLKSQICTLLDQAIQAALVK